MSTAVSEVLDHSKIEARIRRIAWQIYEDHQQESEVVLAGIAVRGFILAELVAAELQKISPLLVHIQGLEVNKEDPLVSEPRLIPGMDCTGKCIIVVDDVLNSGSTLIYGVRYFLDFKVKQIKTAILVDRNHKSFQVKADYKGISLSTGVLEHVEVYIEETPYRVEVS